MKYINLGNSVMPYVAIGTWQLSDEEAYNSVSSAIKAGYRHIDTAMIYGNEEAVGRAIKDCGVAREELFITTKVWNSDQGYESCKKALQDSLDRLGLKYVDLYLIHWPKTYEKTKDTWTAMEELKEEGKIKEIGVSNFLIHHIKELLKTAKVKPVINQIEAHIRLQNDELKSYCNENGIEVSAYAPLMSKEGIIELLGMEELQNIASNHGKTVPQVALRFLVDLGYPVLPRSRSEKNIKDNINLFDFMFTDEEFEYLKSLNEERRTFPDPDTIDF